MKFDKYVNPHKRKKLSDPFSIKIGRFTYAKEKTVYRTGWSEDVFISDSQEKDVVGKSFDFSELPVITFLILFFLSILIARTAWLQILKGDYYYSMAEGNRIRVERIEPDRGIIYDRNLVPLVRNKANFLLYFIPADLPEDENELNIIIERITNIVEGLNIDDVKSSLSLVEKYSLESYQPLFIVDNISYENAMRLYLESADWPGVILSTRTKREYLGTGDLENLVDSELNYGNSMSHILGYTGKISENELKNSGQEYLPIDYIGKMGIEYFWENELKGISGKKQIEVDALGKEKKIINQEEASAGYNLLLSLDVAQQKKLEEILLKYLKQYNLSLAAAIVQDPNNGEILAMVSLPSYDNNSFAQGISFDEYSTLINDPDKPLFNRCVSGEYPSGSTIKPVMAVAALEEGIITERTSFNSVGGISIGQWFFPDWRAGGHGITDVRRAIAESVNTFFYYIGGGSDDFNGLGVDRIIKYENLFGLGSQLGIDLAGEASGFLPTRQWKEEVKGEKWYIGDTYHLSIGQGDLLVTPLQVAAYTSFFANGGKLYRPHFVKEILSSDDQLIKSVDNDPIREDFINEYNISVVRQGMRQTIVSGSARSLQLVPVAVAGKTGTAQWSSKEKPHAWFTGFAPYENPEIVVTILVERAGEGSEIAVPISREFLTWYFSEYKNK